jgi:hypothetical protein
MSFDDQADVLLLRWFSSERRKRNHTVSKMIAFRGGIERDHGPWGCLRASSLKAMRGRSATTRSTTAKELRIWKIAKRAEKSFANGWHFRRISDIPKNRSWHSPKRRSSKTSSIAVDAIRTANFGAIRTRKSWDGSHLALASRDERHGGVWNHRHPSSSSCRCRGSRALISVL